MMSASLLGWEGREGRFEDRNTEVGRIAVCWVRQKDKNWPETVVLGGSQPESRLEVHRAFSCPGQGWGKRRGLLFIVEAMGNH